ncbi:MAG: tyrosine-type recombinase/integrase [Hyphomicrobiaceae bacterium]|nr:tyrosine-type recombinase/integrase [Hyphomicrobiaceae bacterium]
MPALPAPAAEVAPQAAQHSADALVSAFLKGRSPRTIAAYERDLAAFRAHVGARSVGEAMGALLSSGQGEANRIALDYRDAMTESGLAPATVNRRLAAIRSFVKLGRLLGYTTAAIEVPGVRSESYRDVRGPSLAVLQGMLDEARTRRGPGGTDHRARRDVAALRLTFDLALRRAELLELRLGDIEGDRVWLLRKGKRERIAKTLPLETMRALQTWLAVRPSYGAAHDFVFVSFSNRALGKPLSADGWHQIVGELGERLGLHVHPHAIRHASITAAAVATGGNMVDVQEHSGHANIATARRYVAAAADTAGKVAALVASGLD